MIAYLLDTDICIHAIKGRNAALASRFKVNDGRMAVCDISLFELYYGSEHYVDSAARVAVIESLTARLQVIPFESRAAMHAGRIRAMLEKKGQGIGAYDVLIAGCAISQGLILVTNNLREFDRVEGLRTERWL